MDATSARTLLDQEQRRLLSIQRGLGADPVDGAQADNGSTVFETEKERSLAHQVALDLREVADARARVEAGTYGRCATCDEPISVERLEAVPATRYCATHEGMWEADRLSLSTPAGRYADTDVHGADRRAARDATRHLDLLPDDDVLPGDDDGAGRLEVGAEQAALHLADPDRADPGALRAEDVAALERRRDEWAAEERQAARTDAEGAQG